MPKTTTRIGTIHKLLARKSGASMAQLQEATTWQSHSIRAALSGLRKTGTAIAWAKNAKGETVYRITAGGDQA